MQNNASTNGISICLASDAKYAFPTACVAKKIAMMDLPNIQKIFLLWVDQEKAPKELNTFLKHDKITVVEVDNSKTTLLSKKNGTHLTSATLARLFLSDYLSNYSIGKLLYLDGDIQIVNSIATIADIDLPIGNFAITDEPMMALSANLPWAAKSSQDFAHRLGLAQAKDYFNTGVILAHMESWATISKDAQNFYQHNHAICDYMDQCALNAVAGGRRLRLSPKWNFQPFLTALKVEKIVNPNIVHFCAWPKPWGAPVLTRAYKARQDFLYARTEMPELWKITAQKVSYKIYRKSWKQFLRFDQRSPHVRQVFLDYFQSTPFIDMS